MARTVFPVLCGFLIPLLPWIAVSARADDARSALVAIPQNARLGTGGVIGSAAEAATPSLSSVSANSAQNASLQVGSPASTGTSTPSTPLPSSPTDFQASPSQRANLFVQTGHGAGLDARLSQKVGLQSSVPVEDVQPRQTLQASADPIQARVGAEQNLRVVLGPPSGRIPPMQASLRQQATVQGTAPGATVSGQEMTRVRTTNRPRSGGPAGGF